MPELVVGLEIADSEGKTMGVPPKTLFLVLSQLSP